MSKKTQEKEIDGKLIQVTQFPAGEGLKISVALFKLLGPSLGGLITGKESVSGILDGDVDFGVMIEALAERLDEEKGVALVKRLLKQTLIDKTPCSETFDVTFQGEYLFLFNVLRFTLEVNFKSFLPKGVTGTTLTAATPAAQTTA